MHAEEPSQWRLSKEVGLQESGGGGGPKAVPSRERESTAIRPRKNRSDQPDRKRAVFRGSSSDVEGLIDRWRATDRRAELDIVHEDQAFPGRLVPFPDQLSPELVEVLKGSGIQGLYPHQRDAFDLLEAGEHVVVATPTASGKSLCFHLPVLRRLQKDPSARVLALYPTKALSRDQLAGLQHWVDQGRLGIRSHVYDGDTPSSVRRVVREEGQIIATNPFMLHTGILPHHGRWVHLFRGLTHVIADELHTYRGIYGSHVANVFRRLKRLCRHYGSDPRFVFASATIANPRELAEMLCGEEVALVDHSAAPRGRRLFATIKPPVVHRQLGLRRSAPRQAVRLGRALLESGLHGIFFERSRNGVEILVKYLKDIARKSGLDPNLVRGYRGGYLPKLRREIESGLRDGGIRLVVATNALELGIDIGSLDVVVLVGYPGSVASTLQRAGRAGRRERASLTVLIGRNQATDQYVVQHPEYLFEGPAESVAVDPDNVVIRAQHLKCAVFELPFSDSEEFGGIGDTHELLEFLTRDAKLLAKVEDRYYFSSRAFPADGVSLVTGDIDNFVILDADTSRPMAEIDRPSAMTMVHPEAIYQHQGDQYYVESMDYVGRRVTARRVDVDYYTEAEVEAEVRVLTEDVRRSLGRGEIVFGDVSVRKIAPVYKKIRYYTREVIGAGDIQLPPEDLDTEGLMLVLPERLRRGDALVGEELGVGMQGFADLFRRVVPLWVRCDPADVGVTVEPRARHFDRPTVFLWDETPGGVGLAEKLCQHIQEVLDAMADVLRQCSCEQGCPQCIGATMTEEGRNKAIVTSILAALRQASLPSGVFHQGVSLS